MRRKTESEIVVIRNKVLEWFLLGFGLKTADDGLGRPTAITPLLLAAEEKCGPCDLDEVLDALYNLSTNHAELHKLVAVGDATFVRPGRILSAKKR